MNKQRKIEKAIYDELNERSFEDILEDFDLDPSEVFYLLYTQGHIDEELLEKLYDIS